MTPPTPDFLVRHGAMRLLGAFAVPAGLLVVRGDKVVIRTDRGVEAGDALAPATPQAVAAAPQLGHGDLLRVCTDADLNKLADIESAKADQYARAAELITHHRLAMQVVDLEATFGGERLVFYFLADGRVDFRELVKSMARDFRARIELRQIGVRDEAKLLADYGDCGKPVCCNTHMAVMPPVSMRMAKLQKSTLDPSKISGRCGRLKCCLRFEQDVYEEFVHELPPVGCRVVTGKGQGRVIAQEVLARRLLIEFEDGRRLPVTADEVLTRL